MSNRLKNKWSAHYPFHHEDDLPHLIQALTELVVITGGILSTAQWMCSDKYLDYGYYTLSIEYYKYV